MSTRYLFVADIHLSWSDQRRTRTFLDFLHAQADRTDHLFILGDLFDLWVGPGHEDMPEYREFLEALPDVMQKRMKVSFVYGNRDFFIGRRFPAGDEIEILRSVATLDLDGRRVYLTHGDELCSRDRGYRTLVTLFRNRFIYALNRALPFWAARYCVRAARTHARRSLARKQHTEVAIVDEAVDALFEAGNDVVVCGHVHRPRHAVFQRPRSRGELFVLGSWHDGSSWLEYEDGRWRLFPDVECEEIVLSPRRPGASGGSQRSVAGRPRPAAANRPKDSSR